MKAKILVSALCSSTFLLTACGGGSGSDSYQGSNNVDYNKQETIDLITMPVTGLITSDFDNFIIEVAHIAEEIHYSTMNTTASCKSGGTVTKNSNGSITLNNCKNIAFNGEVYDYAEDLVLSGTINSIITDTDTTEQYDITLTNLTVKYDDEVETYNGRIVEKFVHNDTNVKASYLINNIAFSWADKTDKESYTLSNYTLNETFNYPAATPATAKGKLQGDINGKKFSVNFDSNVKYSFDNWGVLTDATINIEDTANKRNAITIIDTIDGKARISAYTNGTSVAGYPKTESWSYFY